MPLNLQRSNFPFPFTNRLPTTNGKVSVDAQYFLEEMERMYEAIQKDLDLMFAQLTEQVARTGFTLSDLAPLSSASPGKHPAIFVDGTGVYFTIADNTWRKASGVVF